MRSFLILLLTMTACAGHSADDALNSLVAKSELIVIGTIPKEATGWMSANSHFSCEVKVEETLKGQLPEEKPFRVRFTRVNADNDLPKVGEKYVFFLNAVDNKNASKYQAPDYWFGIVPYKKLMVDSIKYQVARDKEEERWREYRKAAHRSSAENMPTLMKLADGDDVEVALQSLSALTSYGRFSTPELVELLQRKMKDPNPKVAFQAAETTCYIDDWSGFDTIVDFTNHSNAEVNEDARKTLLLFCGGGDSQRRDKSTALAVKRLRVEQNPVIIEQLQSAIAANQKAVKAARERLSREQVQPGKEQRDSKEPKVPPKDDF